MAVFAIPAKFVVDTIAKVGDKGIAAAVLIPSGFAETGEEELQRQLVATAREHDVRFIGPNIYGVYYTAGKMSAAFTTPYDVQGPVALASQSGGIGMGILGFSRSTKLGVSAIVGLGNKADIDEDDLLTFFEHDDATQCIALHMEDLKDGRAFVEAARRVSKKKPVIVLKAGATPAGAKAAASHTAALAGDDKVYDDILRQAGVVRARGLQELLQFARCLPILPTPKGENVVIITGAGGSGVLLSDACYNTGLELMEMPDDLNEAFMKFIPPFGAAGNPVDITGGEPPETYRQHRCARAGGRADPRARARLLAHDRDPPDGVREGDGRGGRGVPRPRHREAGRRLARRRRRGRGGLAVPVRPRDPCVPVHDGDAGRGLGGEIPLGPHGRAARTAIRKGSEQREDACDHVKPGSRRGDGGSRSSVRSHRHRG